MKIDVLGQLHNVQRKSKLGDKSHWLSGFELCDIFCLDLIEIKLKHWTWNGQFSTAHFEAINDAQCTLHAQYFQSIFFSSKQMFDGEWKERPMG